MNKLRLYFNDVEFEQLKRCEDIHAKCLSIALRLFNGIKDKSGKPYIGHLLRVSSSLEDLTESSAGLLHDVIEDIEDIKSEDLLDIGIPKEVVDIVLLVTKEKGKSYEDEISKIINSGNNKALNLKIADISDNSSEDRLESLDIETKERLKQKYLLPLRRLKEERNRRND